METKKNPKVDLNKQRSLLMNIGLALSLLLVTVAFEWRVYDTGPADLGKLEDEFEELIDVPLTQQPPPPPPPVFIPPEIIEVPDDEEIEEEIIDIDVDMTEDMAIEDLEYVAPPEEDIDRIFTIVEEPAGPIGGRAAFYKYINKTILYPKQASRMGLEGKVRVRFVVERDGTLSNFEVIRGIGGGCDNEALRVLKACPIRWSPGRQRGKPVRVHFSMPIYFKLYGNR